MQKEEKKDENKDEGCSCSCCNPEVFRKLFEKMEACCSKQNEQSDCSKMMKEAMRMCCSPKKDNSQNCCS